MSSRAPAEEAPPACPPPTPRWLDQLRRARPRRCYFRVSLQNRCPSQSNPPAGSRRHPSPCHRKARFPQPLLSHCASECDPRVARGTYAVPLSRAVGDVARRPLSPPPVQRWLSWSSRLRQGGESEASGQEDLRLTTRPAGALSVSGFLLPIVWGRLLC